MLSQNELHLGVQRVQAHHAFEGDDRGVGLAAVIVNETGAIQHGHRVGIEAQRPIERRPCLSMIRLEVGQDMTRIGQDAWILFL